MKPIYKNLTLLLLFIFSLTGCNSIGTKSTSMTTIYIVTTIISLFLLITFCCLIKEKNIWILLLFSSVFIVNIGYMTLSLSKTVDEALLANRISYLGSVFLPLAMLMNILTVCKIPYKKLETGILLTITIIIFLIAASPGYFPIYYKEVSLSFINGAAILNKTYGSWHILYLLYLLTYFSFMVIAIIYAFIKKKLQSILYAFFLLSAVLVNICIWLLEQLVKIDFEFLSASYIISELFLLILYLIIQESNSCITRINSSIEQITVQEIIPTTDTSSSYESEEIMDNSVSTDTTIKQDITTVHTSEEQISKLEYFESHLYMLTPTERTIYQLYLDGKTTKEIMQSLNIKENTVKFHNKNIYSKLGVSSRKQLIELSKILNN